VRCIALQDKETAQQVVGYHEDGND